MNFTVKRLLNNKQLNQSKVVAGVKGMENIIISTNMMDNPQSFEWLMPGDLILTTGFVFKDDKEFQKKVIQELVAAHCSALALKPRKYFGSVPQEMIDLANEYQFPIIEIPAHLSMAQFSNIVNKEIFRLQDSIVQKTLYIHEKLTDISLAGGGMKDILTELAFVIENPLLLLDEEGNVLELQDWKGAVLPYLDEFLHQEGGARVPVDFLIDVPRETVEFRKSIKKLWPLQDCTLVCRVLPIKALQELLGYVVVFEMVTKLERIDYIAIEKGATIIALDILKKKEIEDATLQVRNDFFQDLLYGRIDSEKKAAQLASQHNLMVNMNQACIILQVKKNEGKENKENIGVTDLNRNRTFLKEIEKVVANLPQKYLSELKITAVAGIPGKRSILIAQLAKTLNRKEGKALLELISNQLQTALSSIFPDYTFLFGIGKVYEEWLSLSHSREEAEEALKMNIDFDEGKMISHYDDYLIYELLNDVRDKELLNYFYEESLQALDEYDEINNMNLVDTLCVYFKEMGNIGEASRQLFIHRNTMVYRMDKITNILDIDLRDSEELLKLQLGIHIRQLLNKK